MTYELAKKLKDAGYPQNKDNGTLHPDWCTGWGEGNKCNSKDQCRDTTLSELIEACGGKFIRLVKQNLNKDEEELQYKISGVRGSWIAFSYDRSAFGSTPEEAVALLWLELQK